MKVSVDFFFAVARDDEDEEDSSSKPASEKNDNGITQLVSWSTADNGERRDKRMDDEKNIKTRLKITQFKT